MNHQLFITLAILSIITSLAAQDWNSPQLKSFSSAQQECAVYLLLSNETVQQCEVNGYPDDFNCRKLVNCILVQIYAYDERIGIRDNVITNFFEPPKSCSDYVSRTQECLQTTVPKQCGGQPFERAYLSFQCYYRNYGVLLKDAVRFLPYDPSSPKYSVKQIVESFSIANTSCKAIRNLSEGRGFTVENVADALYAFGIRNGFYDLQHGLYVDRLYTQVGVPNLLSEATRQCLACVSQQYNTEPLRITQLVLQCVEKDIATQLWFTQTAQAILASNNSYCNVCEPLRSCVDPTPSTQCGVSLVTTPKNPYPSI
ncbi:AAEL000344-PA [Aedes aegypti]|uniref:AAEL000344-PA n=2 Tax=Aedes aegypti TaxID=7159 RepID=A0A1S4EVK5_AEDAE|nr:uncharacterized protein LOC5575172 [Aedes aegypti]EAT48657.1 AAEL000344-PA [Aedes aegypti]